MAWRNSAGSPRSRLLQQALWRSLDSHERIKVLAPNCIRRFDQDESRVRIEVEQGKPMRCRLLVAADGARSALRIQAGIAVDTWHYNQKALVTHIETEKPNRGLAWQRFTEHGPLALLPLADGRSSIVWSQPAERVEHLLAGSDDAFLEELNANQDSPFGSALSCTARHGLPLVRRKARQLVDGHLVLLGDAARTVHPLAGQGLNLGLADAAALAEVLDNQTGESSLAPALQRYQRWRQSASALTGGGIHAINELAFAPGDLGRMLLGLGFGSANRLWPIRERFVRTACGLDSDSPLLARQAGQQQ
jgi:ubiquinone biosynthesis UbiH/UbiF/VisC/COQ6 family hydroxylase